jgi:glycosyltransferase involved in cell wall biosynthesis
MKIAIVTPYYKEADEILLHCRESVLEQTRPCEQFMVADGFPNPLVKKLGVHAMELPFAHNDAGNTPRVLAALSAFTLGYDAVAFLDADNWYYPDHLERMVALKERTGAAVCTASRSMHRPDGSYMFDDDKNDGVLHVDTNCLFLTREAMPLVARWSMIPPELRTMGDTVYWQSIRRSGLVHAHERRPSVAYRTTYENDFRRLGEALPEGGKTVEETGASIRWVRSLGPAQRRRMNREIGWPGNLVVRAERRLHDFLAARKSRASAERAGPVAAE